MKFCDTIYAQEKGKHHFTTVLRSADCWKLNTAVDKMYMKINTNWSCNKPGACRGLVMPQQLL